MSDIIPGCRERTNFIYIELLINSVILAKSHLVFNTFFKNGGWCVSGKNKHWIFFAPGCHSVA